MDVVVSTCVRMCTPIYLRITVAGEACLVLACRLTLAAPATQFDIQSGRHGERGGGVRDLLCCIGRALACVGVGACLRAAEVEVDRVLSWKGKQAASYSRAYPQSPWR